MNRPSRYLAAQRHGPLWMLCVGATSVIALAAAAALSGCGGGDSPAQDTAAADAADGTASAAIAVGEPSPEPTLAAREAAARRTANTNANCTAIQSFHWQIGDASGRLAAAEAGTNGPVGTTEMSIASASKLVYGAYVAELRAGQLSQSDIKFLTFTSGYMVFDHCLKDQTVAECQSYQSDRISNGGYMSEHDSRFYYSGGHMQKHATLIGLGADDNAALQRDISAGVRQLTGLQYTQPQLAGGVYASANDYGRFLQRIVRRELKIADLLGKYAVCTNPLTCSTADHTPVPSAESWHYSIGHWVEDDPKVGDGAFSSPGAFGFYPWIDQGRRWWGVLARESHELGGGVGQGALSTACGREIRAAWISGKPR